MNPYIITKASLTCAHADISLFEAVITTRAALINTGANYNDMKKKSERIWERLKS